MYPAAFEYHRATSVSDAIAMMERYGDSAKVLAGGHSLLPVMKLRFATPHHVIDIGRIASLSGITETGGQIVIGALTRHADVASSSLVASALPALGEAARAIGDVQVRNRGTIGGSLAHGDPGADLPAALIALNAQIVVTGKGGDRTIVTSDFCTYTFTTALEANELVTQVRIPIPAAGTGSAYVKYADAASGYAIVGVAAAVTLAGGKAISARVGMTGMGPKPMRLTAVETAITGQPTNAVAQAGATQATQGFDLFDDARGTAAYKSHLVSTIVGRAIAAAVARA